MSDDEVEVIDHMPKTYVEGFPCPTLGFKPEIIQQVFKMKPKKGDIFLNVYPKCGTTWTQFTMWEIVNDGAPPPNTNQIMFKDIPFLEFMGLDSIDKLKDPRMFKLHLPFRLTPWSPEAKYISVLRNPFDCCVSYYYHFNNVELLPCGQKLRFDSYVNDFVNGDLPFGCYFEHINSFFEKRNEPNVLFFSFESAKEKPKETILMIAEFMGPEYKTKLEKDPEMMERILKHTSFQYMKEHNDFKMCKNLEAFAEAGDKYFDMVCDPVIREDKNLFISTNFFRKGKVGTSKVELSSEQWALIERTIEEKVKDPELKAMMYNTKPT